MLRLLGIALALVLFPLALGAPATSISAEAFGSATPGLSDTEPLINGDFSIETLDSFPLGDGEDDWTRWTFDVTSDPGFASFSVAQPLQVARLVLTLTVGDPVVFTDEVSIEPLGPIADPAIQTLADGVTATIAIDLLSYYTSAAILGEFTSGGGTLPMLYQDDAIVSYARLDLESVPEPGTGVLALAGLFTLGHAVWRRR